METLTREALTRKTMPDLVHVIRRLGGDSQPGESRESLVSRILLFAPQKWKEEVKVKKEPVAPVTADQLRKALKSYLLRGLKLEIKDGVWTISVRDRQDSGTLAMPLDAIERCAKYLMPKDM